MNWIIRKAEEFRDMIESVKRNYKKILIGTVALVAIATMVGLGVTAPCAVYADGTKVYEPYVVKAGGNELFLVGDAQAAENIIETVIDEYSPDGAKINSITVDKKITTDKKNLKRGEEAPTVLTEEEAVDYVLAANSSENPLFSVTINAQMGELTDVEVGKTYQENKDMYEGETKVKSKGEEGSQIVTNETISVNGAVLTSEVVDKAVVKDSVDTVIYKGTKERPKDTVRADYSGSVMGSGNGAAIANYACKFIGNPYKYGGTSPEHGADCSGFVQAIYGRHGISLPRTVGPQSYCGKGVSLAEAKAGDLICYSGHIGIYIGGGKMVHASTPRGGIKIGGVHSCGSITTVRRIVE